MKLSRNTIEYIPRVTSRNNFCPSRSAKYFFEKILTKCLIVGKVLKWYQSLMWEYFQDVRAKTIIDKSLVKVNNETLFQTETAYKKLKAGKRVFICG